jgi:hypothetical protein
MLKPMTTNPRGRMAFIDAERDDLSQVLNKNPKKRRASRLMTKIDVAAVSVCASEVSECCASSGDGLRPSLDGLLAGCVLKPSRSAAGRGMQEMSGERDHTSPRPKEATLRAGGGDTFRRISKREPAGCWVPLE